MPNFWGCRCCGRNRFVTHRVFSAAGVHQWSKLHPLADERVNGVTADSGGRVVSVKTGSPDGKDRNVAQWDTVAGTLDSATGVNQIGASDWARWIPDGAGNLYLHPSPSMALRKFDSSLTLTYDVDVGSLLPVIGSTSYQGVGSCVLSPDESQLLMVFGRSAFGTVHGSGFVIVNDDGTLSDSFEDSFSGLTPVPDTGRFDSDGNVVLMFAQEVSDGTNSGNIWKFQPDGTYIDSFSVSGFSSSFMQNGVYSNSHLFSIDVASNHIKSVDLSTGSVLNTVDLSAFDSLNILCCDQLGNVFASAGTTDCTVFGLDQDLNLIWHFDENPYAPLSGFAFPISPTFGLSCWDGYVAFGGGVKRRAYDAGQLVIYP